MSGDTATFDRLIADFATEPRPSVEPNLGQTYGMRIAFQVW
jgi:hypothetical protein